MAILCIHCGTELPDSARYCMTCGKPPGEAVAALAAAQISTPSSESFAYYLQTPSINSAGPSASDLLLIGAITAPAPAQRKGRRKPWIALMLVAVVLLGGVGGLVYFLVNQSTPTRVLQAVCDSIELGDKQAINNMLTSDFQGQSEAEILLAAADQQGNRVKGGVVDCSVAAVSQHGLVATGTVIINYGNGGSERLYLQLVDEHGVWKISNITGYGCC